MIARPPAGAAVLRPSRRSVLLGLAGTAAATTARAAPQPERVPVELFEEALELEAAVAFGNANGTATLVEFFDYNCPWCRQSARDLGPLLAGDPDLAYVLVNFAVLGAPSVEATRVALAYADRAGPKRYLALHEALFEGRGVVNGERALLAAERLGAARAPLAAAANEERITARMREALRVGNSLGLVATPSFVIGPEAYHGHLSLEDKRAVIARARA